MKFSSSLKFNAVAEWWDEYIAYDALKKAIYQLERTQHEAQTAYRDLETAPLVDHHGPTEDNLFEPLLDRELSKICAFYAAQEKELQGEVAELEELVRQQEEAGMGGNYYVDDDGTEEEDDDDRDSLSRSPQRRRRRVSSSAAHRVSFSAAEAIPEEDVPRAHRLSVSSSSSDGHAYAAHDSPGGSPTVAHHTPAMMTNPTTPMGTLGRLRNKLTPDFMRSSITSSVLGGENVWTSKSDFAYDTRLLFKRRITTLYITVTSLRSYVEINQSGFRKILKKYDKVTDHQVRFLFCLLVLCFGAGFQCLFWWLALFSSFRGP
ncbi:SPX domain-containing protein [Mycena galopus ATCC 62051]|nr:SPX domain-containing protein [Mycena galopus ATCC 62051]